MWRLCRSSVIVRLRSDSHCILRPSRARQFSQTTDRSNAFYAKHKPLGNVVESVDCGGQDMPLSFEAGKLALMADGSCVVRMGGTTVLMTAVSGPKPSSRQHKINLAVDYSEKGSASGRIPGSYHRRDVSQTDKEHLVSSWIERAIHPLLPEGYLYETEISGSPLSADEENEPDVLAVNAASAALCISDIPWNGPVGAVRIGRIDNRFVVNPTHKELLVSDLNLVYVGTGDRVMLLDGSANQISAHALKQAIQLAQQEAKKLVAAQLSLVSKVGKSKRVSPLLTPSSLIEETAHTLVFDKALNIFADHSLDRNGRAAALSQIQTDATRFLYRQRTFATLQEDIFAMAVSKAVARAYRDMLFTTDKRCDGRNVHESAVSYAEVDVVPQMVHGSALFAKGSTQVFVTSTLAPIDQALRLEAYTGGPMKKRFIVHCDFPAFSTNSVERRKKSDVSKKESLDANLTERALLSMLPCEDSFPYAIRINSEVLQADGSLTLASICGASMALMDAGVPIAGPVAGTAVGLMMETAGNPGSERYRVLTDMSGLEDYLGDMDLKVAGSHNGITGLSMNTKMTGVPLDILFEAIDKSITDKKTVLDVMQTAIEKPRSYLKLGAPKIALIPISAERRGTLIGPGGQTIRALAAETGCALNLGEDGMLAIHSKDQAAVDRTVERVIAITSQFQVGDKHNGVVTDVQASGLMVSANGRDVFVHVSDLSHEYLQSPLQRFQLQDKMEVVITKAGPKPRGSRKALLAPPQNMAVTVKTAASASVSMRESDPSNQVDSSPSVSSVSPVGSEAGSTPPSWTIKFSDSKKP